MYQLTKLATAGLPVCQNCFMNLRWKKLNQKLETEFFLQRHSVSFFLRQFFNLPLCEQMRTTCVRPLACIAGPQDPRVFWGVEPSEPRNLIQRNHHRSKPSLTNHLLLVLGNFPPQIFRPSYGPVLQPELLIFPMTRHKTEPPSFDVVRGAKTALPLHSDPKSKRSSLKSCYVIFL